MTITKKCRKCNKYLSLSHYAINVNTGSLFTHCLDCKAKAKAIPIKSCGECKENNRIENNAKIPLTRVNSCLDIKEIFKEYGFREERIFIAAHERDYINILQNVVNPDYVIDNILAIFEINNESSFIKCHPLE